MGSEWEQVLDALEERIDAHRAVLEGSLAPTPYDVPTGIGPLPVELVGRASVILARQQQLEAELETRMAEMRTLFARPVPRDNPPPIYLDQLA